MITAEYSVDGMTCDHCVRAVGEEVSRVAGGNTVEVNLAEAVLRITGDHPVDSADVIAAVDTAGYHTTAR